MKQVAAVTALASAAAAAVVFEDDFKDTSKWSHSSWKPEGEMAQMEALVPKFAADPSNTAMGTPADAKFYATSATFTPVSTKGKSLLVQYEVTHDTEVDCGGSYLKVGPKMDDPKTFGDPTEYALMFGPDKCGYTSRTHLIFNYKGKNVLKKVDLPFKQDQTGISTLYRLIVHPDNKVYVKINDEVVYEGEMEKDWELLAAKEIDDPADKKPEDWVDDAMIDDPEDKKPADWVEEKEIADAEAKKPDDWDTEEDGAYEAPMKANPAYKGEWSPKRIDNPAYKGVWAPKKIANPEYAEDSELYLMNKKDLGFVGFDLWQVKSGSKFDNLIIAADADKDALVKEADLKFDAWKASKDKQEEKKKAAEPAKEEKKEDDVPEVDEDDDEKPKATEEDTEDL